MRKNGKVHIVNYENSIKKSNIFSIAKLNHGLTINQVQLLAYAIFCTQQDGKTIFHKSDFEQKFGLDYKTEHAKEDARKLSRLQITTENIEEDSFSFWNVLAGMEYKRGLFSFEWSTPFIPHILDLKEKYVTNDLTVTSKFKSSYTWTLYDYLKGSYGCWHKYVSKEGLLKLFCVEDKISYKDTAQFKRSVLDVAVREINKYTELDVSYTEEKKGRAIVGFNFIWSVAHKKSAAATTKQVEQINNVTSTVETNMWSYLDLCKSDDSKQVEVMSIIRSILAYKKEVNNELTTHKAKEILSMLKGLVQRLENTLEAVRLETNPSSPPKKIFYNWLEERE